MMNLMQHTKGLITFNALRISYYLAVFCHFFTNNRCKLGDLLLKKSGQLM